MFDGNHRVRREVNLNKGSRRRGRPSTRSSGGHSHRPSINSLPAFTAAAETGSRESLLEQTRLLREERRRHQLEEKSAIIIQKVYRGWKGRLYVARDKLEYLWQSRGKQQQQHRLSEDVLHWESFLLSLRLSPCLLAVMGKNQEEIGKHAHGWLVEHVNSIRKYISHHQYHNKAAPYMRCKRIVQATLSSIRPLHATRPFTEENFGSLLSVLDYYLSGATLLWKRLGDSVGLLLLLQSTQECLWWQANLNGQENHKKAVQQLWKWSNQAVRELEDGSSLQKSGQALLAATVMGYRSKVTKDASSSWWCNYDTDNGTASYETYFASLVHCVLQSAASRDDETEAFFKAIAATLNGRWHFVLSNALDWQQVSSQHLPSTPLLQFLFHVLTQHKDLAVLTCMVVKGDDVKSLILLQQKQQQSNDLEDDEDDRLLIEEELEQQAAPLEAPIPMAISEPGVDGTTDSKVSSSNTRKCNPSRKMTKQELQTMPQLEKTYHEGTQKRIHLTTNRLLDQATSNSNATKAYNQSLVEMATQIGNPALWVSWGDQLLPSSAASQSSAMQDSDEMLSTRRVYVQLLALIMQFTTGLRARSSASSPFLSQLAFAGGGKLIEQLWRTILVVGGDEDSVSSQDILTCTMLAVFCDIFAHSLIALSDEKFLQQYANSGSVGQSRLQAEAVIGYLRNLLHEVYWTKPVVLNDVKVASSGITATNEEDASRARFLLSGTKLWNTLYERWCRLLRSNSFCDESTWWFPHLASQEGDSAVTSATTARRPLNNSNDLAEMDIDSDDESDDDAMDQSQDGRDSSQPEAVALADAESDALASSFRDPKMARVLTCIPQALPFDRRVRLFDSLLTSDKLKTQDENAEFRAAMVRMMQGEEDVMGGGRERVEIRRDHLYDDSMRQLNRLGSKLKKKVQVTFINQHGAQESGIDGGGVFKEFVDDLIKDAFSIEETSRNTETPHLFSVTPLQTLTINSSLTQDARMLPHYEFLGRVLGKAVYESILVEPQFCLPFLNQLLGKRNSLEDLKNFDMEYYKNLTKLLTLGASDIEGLGLTFELNIGAGRSMRTVELLPGGKSKPVTKQNVIQYVHLVAHQRLNVDGAVQTKSFLRGFRDLIPASWVRLFSAYELQKLIGGDDSLKGFDVPSLKRTMKYAAGYHPSQPIMQWFWEVLDEFTPDQQRKFLKFMTSCSRQPLLGFQSLDPPPCVQQIRLADELFERNDLSSIVKSAPLPTSSTCMNLLKLPNYRNKDLLRKKLLDAIESGAGFELT